MGELVLERPPSGCSRHLLVTCGFGASLLGNVQGGIAAGDDRVGALERFGQVDAGYVAGAEVVTADEAGVDHAHAAEEPVATLAEQLELPHEIVEIGPEVALEVEREDARELEEVAELVLEVVVTSWATRCTPRLSLSLLETLGLGTGLPGLPRCTPLKGSL